MGTRITYLLGVVLALIVLAVIHTTLPDNGLLALTVLAAVTLALTLALPGRLRQLRLGAAVLLAASMSILVIYPIWQVDHYVNPAAVRSEWRRQLDDFRAQAPDASCIRGASVTTGGGYERVVRRDDIKGIWSAFWRFDPRKARVAGLAGNMRIVFRNGGEYPL